MTNPDFTQETAHFGELHGFNEPNGVTLCVGPIGDGDDGYMMTLHVHKEALRQHDDAERFEQVDNLLFFAEKYLNPDAKETASASNTEYVLTNADDNPIDGERYDNPNQALDARARLMAEHPDGDDVTVEEVSIHEY